LEKLVANPENGSGPVSQNALPETVMAVLRNGPGPFWNSLWWFYETTPARFGSRSGHSTKQHPPISEVVTVVMKMIPTRFDGRYRVLGNDPHPF
jgi:hypothetical protein